MNNFKIDKKNQQSITKCSLGGKMWVYLGVFSSELVENKPWSTRVTGIQISPLDRAGQTLTLLSKDSY